MKPTILIQGQIPQPIMPPFAIVLAPFVMTKRIIETVQRFFQQLIWNELIRGETVENNLFQAIAFVAFCLFCLLSYFLSNVTIPLLLIVAIVSRLEQWMARQAYVKAARTTITLAKTTDTYQWQLAYPNDNRVREQFTADQIEAITICRTLVHFGLSGNPIALVWQIDLQQLNQHTLPIATELGLAKTIAKARSLSKEFKIPFTFTQSEPLPTNWEHLSPSFTWQFNPRGWRAISGWTMTDGWQLIGKIFNHAGWLLFAILLSTFTAQFGDFLVHMIEAYRVEGILLLDFTPLFQLSGFSPLEGLGIAIALGLMVWEGIQLSRVKSLTYNRGKWQLRIGQHQVASIENDLEGVVFLRQPIPQLALWDQNNHTIELSGLPRLDDYRAIGYRVSQTLMENRTS